MFVTPSVPASAARDPHHHNQTLPAAAVALLTLLISLCAFSFHLHTQRSYIHYCKLLLHHVKFSNIPLAQGYSLKDNMFLTRTLSQWTLTLCDVASMITAVPESSSLWPLLRIYLTF